MRTSQAETMHYGLPMIVLCLTPAAFLAASQGRGFQFGVVQAALRVLVALPLLLSGVVLHFFRCTDTASIIPPGFPAPAALVFLTGLLEIGGAIGLFIPRYRKPAALCIALLLIAVFPANIYAAGKTVGGIHMPGVAARTVMQMVYMLLVLISSYGVPRPISADTSD